MGGKMSDDVNITYETLFELLRREKTKEDLQKLEKSFFNDVLVYLKEGISFLEQQKTKNDLFAVEEIKKAEMQEENIRKILRELYEKREKKIITLALDRSRTSSSVIDASTLLKEEKELYDLLVGLLDKFRKGILFNLLEAKEPILEAGKGDQPWLDVPAEEYADDVAKDKSESQEMKQDHVNELKQPEESETKVEPAETNVSETKKVNVEGDTAEIPKTKPEASELKIKKLKFIHAVPTFVGDDLKEYGPFEEEDVAEIPLRAANIIIEKGRAEEVNE